MKTLYDKLWEEHHVTQLDSGESLLYIDRHYLHEVTSPQAFEGLIKKNLKPWRLNANIATPDHNVPCLLYTSPSPRDATLSRMPSSA